MNCSAALEALLDAEPAELSGRSTTPLTDHLESCERCHAVADKLFEATSLLAASVPASRSPRKPSQGAPFWVGRSLVPAGFVAALLLVILWRSPDVPTTATVETGSSSTPVVPPDSALPRTPAAPFFSQRSARIRAYPAPTPVAAVRISPPSPIVPSRAEGNIAVIVDPPAGRRVAVIQTANPKFTVVWLY